MRFDSGQEMLDVIRYDRRDLYNKEAGLYVWLYNGYGSIAYANLTEEDAAELRANSEKTGEYWGAFLGGGRAYIADGPEYYYFEDGDYSNLDWCNDHFEGEWEDVTP